MPNLAEKVSKAAPGAVYGVILIAVMFLMPGGAAGFVGSLFARFRRGAKSAEMRPAKQRGIRCGQRFGRGRRASRRWS